MLLDRRRPSADPCETDAFDEHALAEELERIMARKPRRSALPTLSERGIAPEPAAAVPTAGAEAGAAHEPLPSAAGRPPWARVRRRAPAVRNAQLVAASVISVVVVAAVITGTALALFGGGQEVAALRQLLFSE